MQKILFEFYYGNINPCEGTFPKEDEYRKAADQAVSIESELMAKLDDEGQELYRQLTFALITRDSIEDAYTDGCCQGSFRFSNFTLTTYLLLLDTLNRNLARKYMNPVFES